MITWQDIRNAPVGPVVLLCNAETGAVAAGYGEWGARPFPYWVAFDDTGFGRFQATHFAPMPEPVRALAKQEDEAA